MTSKRRKPSPMPEAEFPHSPIPAANVASVPQRSPLRYPGGKTWLVPHIRAWLRGLDQKPELLIEPFGGGAIVSLTAVMDDLVERCLLAELDPDVAAFWKAALDREISPRLCKRVLDFKPTREAVEALEESQPDQLLDRGFRTLVLNRTRRGGILASGASFLRSGEDGKGLRSRWYPETIVSRLREISVHADRIDFRETDGMRLLEKRAGKSRSVVFADPPYTAGGKRAGHRLYTLHQIDHPRLFEILTESYSDFVLTYDYSSEIVELVHRHGFHMERFATKTTHHEKELELVITRGFVDWASQKPEGRSY